MEEKNMKKKLVILLASLATCAALMTGCGGGEETVPAEQTQSESGGTADNGSGKEEPLVINYISARGETDAALKAVKKLAEDYKKEHPNFEFNVESVADRATYLQKIKILASSNELPDWFDADPEAFFEGLCRKDLIYSVDELYEELGISDRFFDIALDYPRFSDGSNYLMTWQGNVEYFWYHTDMFEQAGITAAPKTLDELLEACQKLQDAGFTPIAAGNYDMIMRYPAFKAFLSLIHISEPTRPY